MRVHHRQEGSRRRQQSRARSCAPMNARRASADCHTAGEYQHGAPAQNNSWRLNDESTLIRQMAAATGRKKPAEKLPKNRRNIKNVSK